MNVCASRLSSAGASLVRGSRASTRVSRNPAVAYIHNSPSLHRSSCRLENTLSSKGLYLPEGVLSFGARRLAAVRNTTGSFRGHTTATMTQNTTSDAGQDSPKEVVLVKNETPQPCSQASSVDFLSDAPRGAYTTGRTVGRDAVFEFEFHVQRLASSVKLMLEADGKSVPSYLSPLVEIETLRPLLLASLRAARRGYTAPGEIKLTVLITWDDQDFDIYSHFVPLPPLPSAPVKVMVKGCPRSNAAAKDSDWVRGRKALEDEKPKDVNEIVLAKDDKFLYEGMSSNFFAVTKGGEVVTAGDGILAGTVRELLLQVCESEGIPVRLEPPSLVEVDDWEGAMVSSTSRLATPIDRFYYPTEEGLQEKDFTDAPLTRRISDLVQGAIKANSTDVFDA